jgi:hypothetical protein
VDKMELLLSPEPGEAAKPGSRNMILFIDINMPVERQRHRRQLNHEQVQSQEQIAQPNDQGDRHQKEQRVILPAIEIMRRNDVVPSVMHVMELDMISEKPSAKAAMTEISMKQCLAERHQEMCAHCSRAVQEKVDRYCFDGYDGRLPSDYSRRAYGLATAGGAAAPVAGRAIATKGGKTWGNCGGGSG